MQYHNYSLTPTIVENKGYDFAYNRYKCIVLTLNEQFGEKEQEIRVVKKLHTLHVNQL